MVGWIVFGVAVIGVVIGFVWLFRSFRRWTQPQPTTAEAKAAEARLWSTKVMDQR